MILEVAAMLLLCGSQCGSAAQWMIHMPRRMDTEQDFITLLREAWDLKLMHHLCLECSI